MEVTGSPNGMVAVCSWLAAHLPRSLPHLRLARQHSSLCGPDKPSMQAQAPHRIAVPVAYLVDDVDDTMAMVRVATGEDQRALSARLPFNTQTECHVELMAFCLSSPQGQAALATLLQFVVDDLKHWVQPTVATVFCPAVGLPASLTVGSVLKQNGFLCNHSGTFDLWVRESGNIPTADAPEGFALTSLNEDEHAATVNETWAYRSSSSLKSISKVIRDQPTMCSIEVDSKELSSWATTMADGSTAQVFTQPAFRRRGRAELTIQALFSPQQRAGVQQQFAYIAQDNAASQGLFQKLGFVATPEPVTWSAHHPTSAEGDKWDQYYLSGVAPWDPCGPCSELETYLVAHPPDPHQKAVELGCGRGWNAFCLAKHGYDVTAIESSSVALCEARRLAPIQGCVARNVTFELGDAFQPDPTLVGTFDFLFDLQVFHALRGRNGERQEDIASAMASLLRPGGHALIITGSSGEKSSYFRDDGPPALSRLELESAFVAAGLTLCSMVEGQFDATAAYGAQPPACWISVWCKPTC